MTKNYKLYSSMDCQKNEQIWKDNDIEINKVMTCNSEFNTVVEKFFVTIKSPKTQIQQKQKRLIDVLKNYNGQLKEALTNYKRIFAKKDAEYKKVVQDTKELELRMNEKQDKYNEEINELNKKSQRLQKTNQELVDTINKIELNKISQNQKRYYFNKKQQELREVVKLQEKRLQQIIKMIEIKESELNNHGYLQQKSNLLKNNEIDQNLQQRLKQIEQMTQQNKQLRQQIIRLNQFVTSLQNRILQFQENQNNSEELTGLRDQIKARNSEISSLRLENVIFKSIVNQANQEQSVGTASQSKPISQQASVQTDLVKKLSISMIQNVSNQQYITPKPLKTDQLIENNPKQLLQLQKSLEQKNKQIKKLQQQFENLKQDYQNFNKNNVHLQGNQTQVKQMDLQIQQQPSVVSLSLMFIDALQSPDAQITNTFQSECKQKYSILNQMPLFFIQSKPEQIFNQEPIAFSPFFIEFQSSNTFNFNSLRNYSAEKLNSPTLQNFFADPPTLSLFFVTQESCPSMIKT